MADVSGIWVLPPHLGVLPRALSMVSEDDDLHGSKSLTPKYNSVQCTISPLVREHNPHMR